jgi:hypothetical protein
MRRGRSSGSITVRFYSAQCLTLKADSAKVEGGVLILYVYTGDRSKLQPTRVFPIESVVAAQLSDGTPVYGEPMFRFTNGFKLTKRMLLEIVVWLLVLFAIAWLAGPAPYGDQHTQIQLRP